MSSHLLRFGSAQDSRDVPPLVGLVEVADVCGDQMLRAIEAYGVTGLGGLRDGRLSVDLELGEVGSGAEPYPRDACWAKPDLDAAADAMLQLYDHPDVTRELGRRTRASATPPTTRPRRRPRSANGLAT
jgi:hypothetical protein